MVRCAAWWTGWAFVAMTGARTIAATCADRLLERRVERMTRTFDIEILKHPVESASKLGHLSYDPFAYWIPSEGLPTDRLFALKHEEFHARRWRAVLESATPAHAAQACFFRADVSSFSQRLDPSMRRFFVSNEVGACYESFRLARWIEARGLATASMSEPAFYLACSRTAADLRTATSRPWRANSKPARPKSKSNVVQAACGSPWSVYPAGVTRPCPSWFPSRSSQRAK